MPTPTRCHAAFALACAGFVSASVHAAGPSAARKAPPEAAVDAIFARYDATTTPGCSVAVIDGDDVLLKKSYGMADPALGVPMRSDTSVWIPYSEARVFVALAVAMLARDGKFALDDAVRRHVPELPSYAAAVTVRQLLHHTSGLADYGVLAGPGVELHDRLSEDEFFRILGRWNKLGFAPGTGRMYSNTDYALLKILVERITGGSLHAFLDTRLLRPLGMTSTRIGADQAEVRKGHALFHEEQGAGFRRLLRYRVSPVGGIAVTSSLDDLVRFERGTRDPALRLPALLKSLEQGAPPPEAGTAGSGFAFGVHPREQAGVSLVEYRGVGNYVWLVQAPATGMSVATLCNAYAGSATFGGDVAMLYVGAQSPTAASPAAGPAADTMPAAVDVPLSVLGSYVGEYRDAGGQPRVDVALVDGALVVTPRGGAAFPGVTPLGNGRFATATPYRIAFESRSPDGMVLTSVDAKTGEPGGAPLQRWRPVRVDAANLRSYAGTYIGDDVELVLHVREAGGRLLLATRGMSEAELEPLGAPDAFRFPQLYTARFERSSAGGVVAIILDATRVKDIRFTRR